jgi:hypothetical protein
MYVAPREPARTLPRNAAETRVRSGRLTHSGRESDIGPIDWLSPMGCFERFDRSSWFRFATVPFGGYHEEC